MWSLLRAIKSANAKPEIQDETIVQKEYSYWRWRIFYSIYIGYAICYFTRKSFTFVIPAISTELNMDKASLGWIGSLMAISYGLSKFVSGMLSDKSNPRYFMAIGLITTGFLNIAFGTMNCLWLFAITWFLNGWFQAFGCCASIKSLTYWYSSSERGRWWGFWNTSHNVGGAIIPVIMAISAAAYGWRFAMCVPGVIAILTGLWTFNRLRDTPRSLGLPIIEKYKHELESFHAKQDKDTSSHMKIIWTYILINHYIWILALGYFLVYIVRTALNDWTMPFLIESKGYSYVQAGQSILFFELGGVFGGLFAGWFSDTFFHGKRGQTTVFFIIGLFIVLLVFWKVPYHSLFLENIVLAFLGFFVFGPHMPIGMSSIELSHKKVAVTSNGLIGWVGYFGAAVAGGAFGAVIDAMGWHGYYFLLLLCVLLTVFILLPLYSVSTPPKKILQKA